MNSMTQQAVFPDTQNRPGLADRAILHFSASIGNLVQVDVGVTCQGSVAVSIGKLSRTLASNVPLPLKSRKDLDHFLGFGRMQVRVSGSGPATLTVVYHFNAAIHAHSGLSR